MRVHVRYQLQGPKSDLLKSYECVHPPLYCCEAMAVQWDGIIGLGVTGSFPVPECLGVVITTAHHWGHGETLTTVTPINNCPWCGATIRVLLGNEGLEDDEDFIPF